MRRERATDERASRRDAFQPEHAGEKTLTDWSALHCFSGSTASVSTDGVLDVKTPAAAGSYAAVLPISAEAQADPAKTGIRFVVVLEVLEGSVGIFASRTVDTDPLGLEAICHASAGPATVRVDGDPSTERLCIRSGPKGGGRVRVHSVQVLVRKCFDITSCINELLPVMLTSPGTVALTAIAATLSRESAVEVHDDEIGELTCRNAPVTSPLNRLWTDATGRLAASVTQELIERLPSYDASKMNPRHGYRGRGQSAAYLNQSIIRVYHLMLELERRQMRGGTLLEIGPLFGQFSLAFRRLGYRVTCIDRYRAYDGALDGHVAHLKDAGIDVIEADRENEATRLAALGQFDVVLAMAVVEHVPHTPREFLQTLAAHVAPGGILALDTPNIARYWNRRRIATGLSVHQSIDDQFHSGIPYEGHHREYTSAELIWMLDELGCRDVSVRRFDYNLLQFPELWPDQLRSLCAITVDPSLADTVLVAGRLGAGGSLLH